MNDIASFRATVEAFLSTHALSPSRFGSEIAGDPQFVFDLRDGREPRSDTRTRILKAMQDFADARAGSVAPFRVGVAGLGTVGAALVRMLLNDQPIVLRRGGRPIVATHVAARNRNKDRGVDLSGSIWMDDAVALARDAEIDLFVELIGGEDGPAYAAIRAALERGVPVVTANKALLAKHGVELARIAEASGTSIGFEAAVAGGIPVIKTLREGLGSASITRVYGIMNGTCNYILTRMAESGGGRDGRGKSGRWPANYDNEDGMSFEACLKEAQELGYAEADPTFDVEGYDTAHKLAILTTLCFQTEIAPGQMLIEGISHINQVDIKVAADLGYKIKLLGIAERKPDGVEQRVHPTLVPKNSAIAGVDGVLNAIALETDYVSELLLAGPGAGGDATAASVLSDILDMVRGHKVPPLGVPAGQLKPYRAAAIRAHAGGYYIRLQARDVPGALASIASHMAAGGISIESVIQRPDLQTLTGDDGSSEFRTIVIITHDTTEDAVRSALAKIAGDGFTSGMAQLIRIEALG
ncbi:MAG: homoserine dehydrogenase [Alphaproteobacteria bacterium]|nr:homoserine dehydrogenase [Alphaproteobacteria bacterium]